MSPPARFDEAHAPWLIVAQQRLIEELLAELARLRVEIEAAHHRLAQHLDAERPRAEPAIATATALSEPRLQEPS